MMSTRYTIWFVAMVLCTGIPLTVSAVLPPDPDAAQGAYQLVGVYDAWEQTTGDKRTVVAVIDNGFDPYHPELWDNTWINIDEISGNGIDDDGNGYIDDTMGWNFVPTDSNNDGEIDDIEALGNNDPRPNTRNLSSEDSLVVSHGTAVAGLIGASGYNNQYGAGIAWNVSLMNLKIVGNSGSGSLAYLIPAIRYAVDNGADVISMSVVGFVEDAAAVQEAIAYAYEHDVVVVAAAGNTLYDLSEKPLYPVCADAYGDTEQVIGVSAVGGNRAFAQFSNYGGDCIDITAPGIGISSTVRFSPSAGLHSYYRGGLQGTSFAVPLVSGTAALIRSLYPELPAASVISAILGSTSKTPTTDEETYTALFGAGLLQVDVALRKAQEFATEQPATIEARIQDTRPDLFTATTTDRTDETVESSQLRLTTTNEQVLIWKGAQQFLTWNTAQPIRAAALDADKQRVYTVETTAQGTVIGVFTLFGLRITDIPVGSLHTNAPSVTLVYDQTHHRLILSAGDDTEVTIHYVPIDTISSATTYRISLSGALLSLDVVAPSASIAEATARPSGMRTIPPTFGTADELGMIGDILYTVHTDVVVVWDAPTLVPIRIIPR